jgi:hypothetical protein
MEVDYHGLRRDLRGELLKAGVALLHGGAWGRHSPFGFVIMRGE